MELDDPLRMASPEEALQICNDLRQMESIDEFVDRVQAAAKGLEMKYCRAVEARPIRTRLQLLPALIVFTEAADLIHHHDCG